MEMVEAEGRTHGREAAAEVGGDGVRLYEEEGD